MDNTSFNMVFTLSAFKESKANKYIFFPLTSAVYLVIIVCNLTLIVTILRERALHDPMYIFLCNLCINGLFGTAGFYPKFLSDLLSDSHVISYNGCLLQIFVIYSYSMCEYTTLTLMAYDRFVAICRPLEYHMIMTAHTIGKLILFSWSFPFLSVLIGILLTNRLPLCGFHIDKLYCDNWSVVKLSCIPTTTNNVFGFIVIILSVGHGIFILYSYMKLIPACKKSRDNQKKFMQTCLPHLISLINFTIAILFDLMFSRYGPKDFPQSVRHFLQVEFLVIPPLFNPLIYGLKVNEVRKRILKKHKVTDSLHTRKKR
ncbi:olfactory receptor 52D1-like [Megalops cyprinoides]|uniref:olfactory receptor 52D1-like n=1 Tax=Megalops cyprinoides TaxID=118141 RepID=UPI001863BCF5|nr:olfactory receptor 52D1-like [Megalops cyprinoides]